MAFTAEQSRELADLYRSNESLWMSIHKAEKALKGKGISFDTRTTLEIHYYDIDSNYRQSILLTSDSLDPIAMLKARVRKLEQQRTSIVARIVALGGQV